MGIPIKIVGGTQPSGTISITENGKHNVARYAIADVNVSGGGDGGSEYNIECYYLDDLDGEELTPIDSIIHPAVWDSELIWWKAYGDAVTKAKPGDVLQYESLTYNRILAVASSTSLDDAMMYPFAKSSSAQAIVMPAHDICVVFN